MGLAVAEECHRHCNYHHEADKIDNEILCAEVLARAHED